LIFPNKLDIPDKLMTTKVEQLDIKTNANAISAQIQIKCEQLTKFMETIQSLSKFDLFHCLLLDAQVLLSQL
jgi:hypothetical protein